MAFFAAADGGGGQAGACPSTPAPGRGPATSLRRGPAARSGSGGPGGGRTRQPGRRPLLGFSGASRSQTIGSRVGVAGPGQGGVHRVHSGGPGVRMREGHRARDGRHGDPAHRRRFHLGPSATGCQLSCGRAGVLHVLPGSLLTTAGRQGNGGPRTPPPSRPPSHRSGRWASPPPRPDRARRRLDDAALGDAVTSGSHDSRSAPRLRSPGARQRTPPAWRRRLPLIAEPGRYLNTPSRNSTMTHGTCLDKVQIAHTDRSTTQRSPKIRGCADACPSPDAALWSPPHRRFLMARSS